MNILEKILAWFRNLSADAERYSDGYHPYGREIQFPDDPDDIRAYRSTKDIFRSGRFTPQERAAEYRRRGKAPAGVIDGVYHDTYLEDGVYNDVDRDWEADA